jgi:hypothetical protein
MYFLGFGFMEILSEDEKIMNYWITKILILFFIICICSNYYFYRLLNTIFNIIFPTLIVFSI